MRVAQPIFEYVRAPRLDKWSQPALVVYIRERRQYEDKVRERATAIGEATEGVLVSVKASLKPSVLAHVAHYVLKQPDVSMVTDEDIVTAIMAEAGHMMNDHVPDIAKMFKDAVSMDLKEPDIEARVLKYYMDFDRVVEDHGMGEVLGRQPPTDAAGHERMKTRCKLLVQGLLPDMLRRDIERLLASTQRRLKTDDVGLFDLIVVQAKQQEHYYLLSTETKPMSGRGKSDAKKPTKTDKPMRQAPQHVGKRESSPPKDGCLVCGGPHWLKECPTASDDQKADALRKLKERKGPRAMRAGAATQ